MNSKRVKNVEYLYFFSHVSIAIMICMLAIKKLSVKITKYILLKLVSGYDMDAGGKINNYRSPQKDTRYIFLTES